MKTRAPLGQIDHTRQGCDVPLGNERLMFEDALHRPIPSPDPRDQINFTLLKTAEDHACPRRLKLGRETEGAQSLQDRV